ncbi:MAG: S-adenosylmethionine:tRNA ribosyltransferase-isomerase [Propionibacteriales bacterium]|nr:S-adenosylmethionine:tRNA ribosyltransferase-isomerase [Propionibacteriales bacterium]
MTAATELRFTLPPGSEAAVPPEARGLARDEVRMLVATSDGIQHRAFRELPDLLHPGDLLVVNVSATLPAAVDVTRHGVETAVHVSTQLDDGQWVVEVRRPDNAGPATDVTPDEVLRLPGGQRLRVVAAYPDDRQTRLWRAVPVPAAARVDYLAAHGRPIRYDYLSGEWPLSSLQTIFATEPGSAEMPSAGRPLSEAMVVRLLARGIPVAPIVLHCGVSSPEAHEPPTPEQFTVPEVTARLARSTRAAGRRVVAVGTTVVRALETVAGDDGRVHAATGWTDLVLGPDRPARLVDGLVTGLHAPEASHLELLDAVAGRSLVRAAYDTATDPDGERYLWHEFGDTTLFLP